MLGNPETRYVRTRDGAYVAYQVTGVGSPDILVIPPYGLAVDAQMEGWHYRTFIDNLSTMGRVVRFDRRGFGLSDAVDTRADNTWEQWVEDACSVLDAVGVQRVALFGEGPIGQLALVLAATRPERVSHLALFHVTARVRADDDYVGVPEAEVERAVEAVPAWLTDAAVPFDDWFPSAAADSEFRNWFVSALRRGASPSVHQWLVRTVRVSDFRAVLPSIQAPTLVIHRDRSPETEHAEYLANNIPGARLVRLDGRDRVAFLGDQRAVLDELRSFFAVSGRLAPPDRVLTTVLFTDIVGSTDQAADVGDARWRSLLDRYDEIVREELGRLHGREIKNTGDGTLATFDGPGRAIQCALTLGRRLRVLGLRIRAGIHTGEVELRDDDIAGIAVALAQRICSVGGPDDVVVSRTVADLVIGSGISFSDRGVHELKGIPGNWQLLRVDR